MHLLLCTCSGECYPHHGILN
ncbi:hypothetical protein PQZ66_gp43 [Klebsiella phage vB_KleM_KB2]|nr:hypothetical protein PQZ66_gp43 [Klebsiella phage vB_KleM_KB2]